jgi:hypothetical protein
MMHFTLQMREVKAKLESQSVYEYLEKMKKHIVMRRVFYTIFFSLQGSILGIRVYVRY